MPRDAAPPGAAGSPVPLRRVHATLSQAPEPLEAESRLADQLTCPPGLSEIAAEAGLSRFQLAAILTGFADQAHLTRWFRRIAGITPGAYRASIHTLNISDIY